MGNKFGMMYSGEIKDYITNLTAESSKLKKDIFKSVMMNRELDPKVAKMYMGFVNDFLRFWDEFSKDLAIKMKQAKGQAGVRTVDYSFVKDYVYAKYDYASVLPFADGVVKGLQDGKFTKVEDIEEFRDHTLKKAFTDLAVNTAGVLDAVINPGLGVDFNRAASPLDAKMFDSMKSYNMFDPRSRTELYRAIDKTIDFITIDLESRHYPQNKDMKLFVSMINNIVEYITYSLTAYACRIYIIQYFAYPFIFADKAITNSDSYSESADGEKENKPSKAAGSEKGKESSRPEVEVTIMRDADDIISKDPASAKKYFEIFEEFVKVIGADGMFNGKMPKYPAYYMNRNAVEGNIFSGKLLSNPLFKMFEQGLYLSGDDRAREREMAEFNQNLKSFTHNNAQAVQGSSTPKQEILHVIRGTECGKTVANYQDLAKDLYSFALWTLGPIPNMIRELTSVTSIDDRMGSSINLRNAGIEALQVLTELYRDIASAILQRARDIEMQINNVRNATIAKVQDSLTIKIPDMAKNDVCSNSNMMSAVPDTTRLPMDLLDLYEIPVFESLQLYDECLRLDPLFADDYYFNEGAGIGNVINSLRSKIIALWKKIQNFFQDRKFKEAVAWVQKHKSELMSMDLSGITMSVIDYKVDITLPEGFENLIKNLQTIPDKALEDQAEMEKWAKTLYPNETIHGWFSGQGDQKKDGARMWRNLFLFQDLKDVDDKPHETPIQINDAQVAKNLPKWIETIETADALYKQLEKMENEIENATNRLRARSVAAANKQGESNNQQGNDGKPAVTAAGATGASTTTPPAGPSPNETEEQKKKREEEEKKKAEAGNGEKKDENIQTPTNILSAAITQADVAVTRLYLSLGPMIVEYMKKEYEYLQTAYSYSKKKQAQ